MIKNPTPDTPGAERAETATLTAPPAPTSVSAEALLSAASAASQAIGGASDTQSLLDGLAKSIPVLTLDNYVLSRFTKPDRSEVELIAVWNRSGPSTLKPGMRFAAWSPEHAAPDGAVIYEDFEADPRSSEATRARMRAMGFRALATFPLAYRGKYIGLLTVCSVAPRSFPQIELDFLSLLAGLASVALANIDDRAELLHKVGCSIAFNSASEAIARVTDEEALWMTAELLADSLRYPKIWIGEVDRRAGVVRTRSAAVVTEDTRGRAEGASPFDDPELTPREALQKDSPSVLTDVLLRARAKGGESAAAVEGLKSVIFVPLRVHGEEIGLVTIGCSEATVSDDEIGLFGAFGNQLALAINRARIERARAEHMTALEEANASQARLLETVRALSTPVIPVHDGVLVLPLVGTLDEERSDRLIESLLRAIQAQRASVVILDITGVPVVDTSVASRLVQATQAAALLGARCLLVGVTPNVAQTLVELGVDLGRLVTRSNLQTGIRCALAELGLQIAPLYEARAR